jgi:hypothetical protein
MEIGEGGSTPTGRRRNIRWTDLLKQSLFEIASKAIPCKKGYHARLEDLWEEAHPTMPSRGDTLASALARFSKTAELASDSEHELEEMDTSAAPDEGTALLEEAAAAYDSQAKVRPGKDFRFRREKLNGKYLPKNKQILCEVDEVLDQIWREKKLGSFYDLNCLLYSGAQVTCKRLKDGNWGGQTRDNPGAEPDEEAEGTQPEDQDVEAEEEQPGLLEDEDFGEETVAAEPHEKPKSKTQTLMELNKQLGWLKAEIAVIREPRLQGKKSRKRGIRRARLVRVMGGRNLSLKRLIAQREKVKGLIRVKLLQKRRTKVQVLRQRQNERMEKLGPKVLGKKRQDSSKIPADRVEGISKFWKGVWEEVGNCEPHNAHLQAWKRKVQDQTRSEDGSEPIPREAAWTAASAKLTHWTAPGPDGIQGYWLTAFPRCKMRLKQLMWEVMEGTREVPRWLVSGRTTMIPKEGNSTGEPGNFRPITCLNTTYKLLTGLLTEMLAAHVWATDVLPEEQKAMRKGKRGCLDAIVIDEAIAAEAKLHRKSLSVAWIDYRKAFDMVPHTWLRKVLKAINAPKVVRTIVDSLIPMWQTHIELQTAEGLARIPIRLKRGLFQGDSLSPLLFCLCVAPLSHALSKRRGFSSEYQARAITHLMFMDDLKLYEENRGKLLEAVHLVEEISTAIGMQLGLRKCAAAHVVGGRVVQGGRIPLATGDSIDEVAYGDTYKYLGMDQLFGVNLTKSKNRVRAEFYKRMRKTWKSELNSRNMVKANNSWAAAVLRYFFGVMKWNKRELVEMDRKARKILRLNGAHHHNASLERLYLPRDEGGRGLQSIEGIWEREAVGVARYLLGSEDEQVQGAMALQQKLRHMGLRSYLEEAEAVLAKYDIDVQLYHPLLQETETAKALVARVKAAQVDVLHARLGSKVIHGVYARETLQQGCDLKATFAWLKSGNLRATTESLIVAAQDGVIHTLQYRRNILKEDIGTACRACGSWPTETLGHILSKCPVYEFHLIKERHDRVLFQLVRGIARATGLATPAVYQAQGGVAPDGVYESREAELAVDRAVPTDRQTKSRRPDIKLRLIKEKRILLMDVACAWDPLVKARENEKRLKYMELAADLGKQWPSYRVRSIPVVVGDLGIIHNLRKCLKEVGIWNAGEIQKLIDSMQRETLCGSVRLIRRHMEVYGK